MVVKALIEKDHPEHGDGGLDGDAGLTRQKLPHQPLDQPGTELKQLPGGDHDEVIILSMTMTIVKMLTIIMITNIYVMIYDISEHDQQCQTSKDELE